MSREGAEQQEERAQEGYLLERDGIRVRVVWCGAQWVGGRIRSPPFELEDHSEVQVWYPIDHSRNEYHLVGACPDRRKGWRAQPILPSAHPSYASPECQPIQEMLVRPVFPNERPTGKEILRASFPAFRTNDDAQYRVRLSRRLLTSRNLR